MIFFNAVCFLISIFGINKHEKISHIVPVLAPQKICSVTYTNEIKVNLGNELTPTQVKDIPSVKWNAKSDQLYTLCMIDLDVPNRAPKFSQVLHWLVGNIPGSNIAKGDTLCEYIGSGPPKGSGFHRYAFLIYKQRNKIDFGDYPRITNRSAVGRVGFKISEWTANYDLGCPVAGNFYRAQYDEYVPLLHEQIGIK